MLYFVSALLLKSIWQRLTRGAPNAAQPEINPQNNFVRLPDVVRPENFVLPENVVLPETVDRLQDTVRPENVVRLNDNDADSQEGPDGRSFLVDGSQFDFVYWNS